MKQRTYIYYFSILGICGNLSQMAENNGQENIDHESEYIFDYEVKNRIEINRHGNCNILRQNIRSIDKNGDGLLMGKTMGNFQIRIDVLKDG